MFYSIIDNNYIKDSIKPLFKIEKILEKIGLLDNQKLDLKFSDTRKISIRVQFIILSTQNFRYPNPKLYLTMNTVIAH